MNTVILSGNLTADPELRRTNGGTAVCEFTIAHNKRWKTDAGEQKEKVSFIGCVIWGRRAEVFAEHHKKGSKALVRGELTQESWDDKTTGKKQSKTKVNVEEFEFVGGRSEQAAAPRPATWQAPKQAVPASGEPEEDEPPF